MELAATAAGSLAVAQWERVRKDVTQCGSTLEPVSRVRAQTGSRAAGGMLLKAKQVVAASLAAARRSCSGRGRSRDLGHNWVRAMPAALAALHSDDRLQVDAGPGKSFSQLDEPATGLIFYADGRVDPRACGQAARALGG